MKYFIVNQNSTLVDTAFHILVAGFFPQKKILTFVQGSHLSPTNKTNKEKLSFEPVKLFDEHCKQRTSEVFRTTDENRRGKKKPK